MGRFTSSNDIIDSGNPGDAISFDDVLNTPTTLAGYGITDAAQANNIQFNSIVNRPTTLAGYGIVDAAPENIDFVSITGKPTTLAGYGITDGGSGGTGVTEEQLATAITNALANNTTISTAVNTAIDESLTAALAPGGLISTTYVKKSGGDTLTGNYNVIGNFNATGVVSAFGELLATDGGGGTVAFTDITGKPTTLAGYGITDAASDAELAAAIAAGGSIDNKYVKKSGGDSLTGNYSFDGNITTTGFITAQGDVTAFSDERLKKDWTDLPTDFIEQLSTVKHGNYVRIDSGQQQVGVSAQELQQILPNAVKEDDNTMLSIAYGNAALVAAIELAKEVVSLKKIIADLVIMVNQKNGL
jgi:hypothetical protein